jgi:diadenylate cyclase
LNLSRFPSLSNFVRAVESYPRGRIIFELLLIGVVVYYVITFLRGTRGARMLRGIAVILILLNIIVKVIASRLNEIAYLYDKFLTFATFAVVVVFQPELRRALLRLGETRLFRGWSNEVEDEIDALVKTAKFLSNNRIGGLVAIEREVPLGAVSESGTRLNADLSSELLNTIFWPNSPLHDLGVVVSAGRIMYAGVQFPLAEYGDVDKDLGSRHRAAVGMSEESDAVVMVVSEETGDISIAENGILLRKLTLEALRGQLIELLTGGRELRSDGPDDDDHAPKAGKRRRRSSDAREMVSEAL